MRANFIHIEPMLREVLRCGVPGDLAEFGVWHGTTFMPMAELARVDGRVIHAVDSFCGMAQETSRDGDNYKRGALSVGGSKVFRHLAAPFGDTVKIHEGFVPDILAELEDVQFAFVHLDLDQYQPTLDALRFLWPRMSPGGVLICHDWKRGASTLAAGAIADWMTETGAVLAGERKESLHGWFVR
jgi:O-methyltransferase